MPGAISLPISASSTQTPITFSPASFARSVTVSRCPTDSVVPTARMRLIQRSCARRRATIARTIARPMSSRMHADRDDAEHEAPRDLQFECVADDREHTDRQRAGAQDPFGLLRAGGEVADLVSAAVLQRNEPAGGHGEAQPEVVQHVPRLLAVDEAEPHEVAEHGRHRDGAQIGDEQQQAVVHHPAGLAHQAGVGPGGATPAGSRPTASTSVATACGRVCVTTPRLPIETVDGLAFPRVMQFTPRADRTPPSFGAGDPRRLHAHTQFGDT